MVARAFLAVSDHGSRARDKNLATLNKGGKDNRDDSGIEARRRRRFFRPRRHPSSFVCSFSSVD